MEAVAAAATLIIYRTRSGCQWADADARKPCTKNIHLHGTGTKFNQSKDHKSGNLANSDQPALLSQLLTTPNLGDRKVLPIVRFCMLVSHISHVLEVDCSREMCGQIVTLWLVNLYCELVLDLAGAKGCFNSGVDGTTRGKQLYNQTNVMKSVSE